MKIMKKNKNSITILHVVLNEFTNDTRILKETESITSCFHTNLVLFIAALKGANTSEYEILGKIREVWRIPLLTRRLPKDLLSQTVKYIEWILKILFKYYKFKPKIVHCHDLNTLPIGVLFKILCKSIIIYDAHELETERHGVKWIRKILNKIMERLLILFADHVITVSKSIAEDYARRYNIALPVIVRNIPNDMTIKNNKGNILREKININNKSTIIFIYQGGMTTGRGIEKLLYVFKKIDDTSKHIVFMGNGPLAVDIKEASVIYNNIHYIPAVSPSDVLYYTKGADVGVYLMDDVCLNHRYSLPNKLFEYIKAELPVIINNLPEQKMIVQYYNCGWVVDEDINLIDFINTIDIKEIKTVKNNVKKAAKALHWDKEIEPVCKIYQKIVNQT